MKLALILVFYISILGWSWGDPLASKNNEGNKLYKNGKIDEALSKWRDAQIENPDNDKLHYNIGNGLHEQKKYEDAFKEYEKSLNPDVGAEHCSAPTKDNEFKANTYYIMGNTHYRMGKLLEAIEDYKKCLEIDPKDEDAKYNIEFIRKKIKENLKKEEKKQQESQQKEGQGQTSQAQEQQKDQKQSESQEQKEGKEAQEKENQAQQENEQQKAQEEKKEESKEAEGKEQKASGEEKKGEMSKEDAVRLLDALKDDEKDVQKELKNQPIEGQYRVDKDW